MTEDRQPPTGPPEQPGGDPTAGMDPEHDERGLDLARSIARGLAGRTGARKRRLKNTRRVDPISSSAHPDDRDPQTLDTTLGRLVDDQGWATDLRVHGVFTRWASVVGQEVASHVTPESYAG
jgi:predicted nucleic acid-binding Zn ribbon protein